MFAFPGSLWPCWGVFADRDARVRHALFGRGGVGGGPEAYNLDNNLFDRGLVCDPRKSCAARSGREGYTPQLGPMSGTLGACPGRVATERGTFEELTESRRSPSQNRSMNDD
jgi:hypothetical protein